MLFLKINLGMNIYIYNIRYVYIFFYSNLIIGELVICIYIIWILFDICIDNIIICYVYNDVLFGDKYVGCYYNLFKYWKKIYMVFVIRGSFDW